MTEQIPSLTDAQLKTWQALQRGKMAWILFYFMLVLTAAAFILLVISVFFSQAAAWVKIGIFLFNGILGWSLKTMHLHLFPKSKQI
jgi:hypothetical protein